MTSRVQGKVMVRIDRVHTGGGDKGESSLVDGSRRLKSDLRFSVVGDCDELNAIIGLVRMESSRIPMHHIDGGDRKNAGEFSLSATLLFLEFSMNCLTSVQS